MEWIVFIIFALLLIARVPVALSLFISAGIVLASTGYNLDMLPQKIFSSLDQSTLMAVPGFILAGVLMSKGGISKSLIEALRAWIGHYFGGLSVVAILACAIFAAISGSSPATAAAIGSIMIPGMVEAGYSKRYSMGLVAAAGTLGILIPPSIPLIIYGTVSGQSIGRLFMSGIIPGLVLTLILIIFAVIYAKIKKFGLLPKASWEERWKLTFKALPAAFLPFLILGAIYTGIATPTEAAVVSCVYALIASVLFYKVMGVKDIRSIIRDTVNTSAMIFLIISAATVFGLYLTNEQVPQQIAAAMMESNVNKVTFLIGVSLLFFVMGMFLEATSIILITLPILLPILPLLGIDPIHFAIIMVINIEIGMITPPVGLNLFVVSSISKERIEEVVIGVFPFIVLMIAALVIVMSVPELSLWLPDIMNN